ncbi:hypothetical protein SCUCBS95973_001625 [Sporothrix curviconia]|uniref:STAS domain-containing protein n=1 Tax=Sporothrix curviconia TaxID=1260050 RepID=A0ABP0B074_9PEZI
MAGKIGAAFRAKVEAIKTDANFSRVGHGAKAGVSIVRAGAGHYFMSKVPIVSWLPMYVPMWLIGDIMAGASVGLIMFPEAVMFAGLSDTIVGPLFFPSLVVASSIAAFGEVEGGPSPALIAATISLCVGIWSFILGMLNLGFVFNSLSVPIVLGFTCGIGIVAYVGQIPTLFGLTNVSPLLTEFTSEFIANLKNTNGPAIGLGAGCIVVLVALQMLDKRLGGRNAGIRLAFQSRNLIVLGAATGIGYTINKDRETPLWLAVGTAGSVKTEASVVQGMTLSLFGSLFLASFFIFLGIAFQHIIVAKALARTGGYAVDCSQELVHLGLSNIANSVMAGFPVGGGDMARASIGRTSGVRSPLSGLVVAAMVGTGMYVTTGFMEWIPLPAAAAVIIVATIDVMPSPGEMMVYWKLSFVDFITFLITFNVSMITTPTMGLEFGGGILAIYTIFRGVAMRPRTIVGVDIEAHYNGTVLPDPWDSNETVPQGIYVLRLDSDLYCANAEGVQKKVLDTVTMTHTGTPLPVDRYERAWNDRRDLRIDYLRYKHGVRNDGRWLPQLRCVIFDMTAVSFIDSSGLHALEAIKTTLRAYGGSGRNGSAAVEFRFVGLCAEVTKRFKRAGWKMACPYVEGGSGSDEDGQSPSAVSDIPTDYTFDHLPQAARWPLQRSGVSPGLAPLTIYDTNATSTSYSSQTALNNPYEHPSRHVQERYEKDASEETVDLGYPTNGMYSPIPLREMI